LPVDQIQYELELSINTGEPEILIKCLGFDLYKQFSTALSGTPDQKWLDLRDGKDYQVNSLSYRWRGFANANKQSIIANYVWFIFTLNSEYYQSGFRKAETENSNLVNPRQRQCNVYNEMVNWLAELHHFITNNISDYPNYNPEKINKINIFNI
jgi:hypothetical protein